MTWLFIYSPLLLSNFDIHSIWSKYTFTSFPWIDLTDIYPWKAGVYKLTALVSTNFTNSLIYTYLVSPVAYTMYIVIPIVVVTVGEGRQ